MTSVWLKHSSLAVIPRLRLWRTEVKHLRREEQHHFHKSTISSRHWIHSTKTQNIVLKYNLNSVFQYWSKQASGLQQPPQLILTNLCLFHKTVSLQEETDDYKELELVKLRYTKLQYDPEANMLLYKPFLLCFSVPLFMFGWLKKTHTHV